MGAFKALKRALTNTGWIAKDKVDYIDDVLMQAMLHPDAHEEGGLACNDKQLLAEMRTCIMQWVKSMGRQILAGNLNLVNTSFPVDMFEPRSYLQKVSDTWAYPQLLAGAATCSDPLERLKLLAAFLVAGSHKGFESWKKPFNPILGETWQAEMEGGITLHMEQVSHHPPVTAYLVEGPGSSWSFSGWSQPAVAPVVKWYGIKTLAKGSRVLRCADGAVIQVHMPNFAIKGVVYADHPRAEVVGSLRLVDAANRLEAVLHFGPVEGTRHRVLERADAVVGEIYQLPKSAGSGATAASLHTGAVTLARTPTAATVLSDMDGSEIMAPPSDRDSSCDGVDAEDEAIYAAVHGKLDGGAPVDANVDIVSAGGSSCGASPLQSPTALPVTGVSGLSLKNSNSSKAGAAPAASAAAAEAKPRHQRRPSKDTLSLPSSGRSLTPGSSSFWGSGSKPAPVVPGVAVAYIEGSWLSHLNIDNKRYWTWSEEGSSTWAAHPAPLPSDSRHRSDLAALAAGDRGAAAAQKTRLEQQQRADRKLREAAGVFEHQ